MGPGSSGISIPLDEIDFDFIHSSGPGGQNVNKVTTAVHLRFDITNSPSLSGEVKERLVRIAGKKVTQDGVLVIMARRYASQERNREDALRRLAVLLDSASVRPRRRRPTRPSEASRQRRMDSKRRRGTIKKSRQPVKDDAE